MGRKDRRTTDTNSDRLTNPPDNQTQTDPGLILRGFLIFGIDFGAGIPKIENGT